jgi:hypothetical protein
LLPRQCSAAEIGESPGGSEPDQFHPKHASDDTTAGGCFEPLWGIVRSICWTGYAKPVPSRRGRRPSVIEGGFNKGDCWDNAPMESFFHSLKTELVMHCDYKTRDDARVSLFDYMEVFYNR